MSGLAKKVTNQFKLETNSIKLYLYSLQKQLIPQNHQMKKVLILIVISQFFCTSLWFAGNAIMSELVASLGVSANFLSYSTSAIQLGFIAGTLLYAIFSISDRFSPSLVFLISALLAAFFNLGINIPHISPYSLLFLRFLTGFFLAGIYPIGIKIAADYYKEGLGKSLGFLVGALVLGTALPHLIKLSLTTLPWQFVGYATSFLSVLGGFLLYLFVPDGPYRIKSKKLDFSVIFKAFKNPSLKAAAVGYFGHMWELYAFWTFTPLLIDYYQKNHALTTLNSSLLSFIVIALGSVACVLSGYLAENIGTKKLSRNILFLSAICCLVSPYFLKTESVVVFGFFICFWSMVVIADSPLFSTLIAQNAPQEIKGSVITLVNCLGFLITIISIQLIGYLLTKIDFEFVFVFLCLGPLIGLYKLIDFRKTRS